MRLKELYNTEIRSHLMKEFGYSNKFQVPKVKKVVLNMGIGDAIKDSKKIDAALAELMAISGQKPVITKARKSIAGFKLREGMNIGVKVTLRGARMYEFLDRLLTIALPRVRDFRGVSAKSFDGAGNYNLGIKEQIIFPEINYDRIDQVRGLDVAIQTTAHSDAEAKVLLAQLGMPFYN